MKFLSMSYTWLSNIEFSNFFCSALMEKQTGLSSRTENQKWNNLLHCWISWLFFDIVIPLIQTYFYVTERESKRYDVFYYHCSARVRPLLVNTGKDREKVSRKLNQS
ncbi:hypothetical protein ABZP36_021270 [Zizania latifolia]